MKAGPASRRRARPAACGAPATRLPAGLALAAHLAGVAAGMAAIVALATLLIGVVRAMAAVT
ncbi:hypothetical protein ACVBGC_00435 [Burkholderia stagnalis]